MLLAPGLYNGQQGARETVATNTYAQIDPETGIPDLVRRLGEDSKRLAGDEVRLAKLELHEGLRSGVAGSIRLALALAFGIVAAVALTVLLVAAVAAMLNHNYWAGALIVGVLELVVGAVLVKRGVATVKSPPYSLRASRESLKDTTTWAREAAKR
jgi:uncharacterized membrane protein YqjE